MHDLEQRLGYQFNKKVFLEQALTHSSLTANIHRNYERLEFLGDRILGVTIAELLCKTFGDEPEGDLAQRFVGLVCKETVAEVMRNLKVDGCIHAANADVCQKDNVLCDVGEAIIAAIYLDSNDMDVAKTFILRNWLPLIDKKSQPKKDYKTFLQEQTAVLKKSIPVYEVIEQTGPQHAPTFVVKVTVDDLSAEGVGDSKKHAEQEAAAIMLEKLGVANG